MDLTNEEKARLQKLFEEEQGPGRIGKTAAEFVDLTCKLLVVPDSFRAYIEREAHYAAVNPGGWIWDGIGFYDCERVGPLYTRKRYMDTGTYQHIRQETERTFVRDAIKRMANETYKGFVWHINVLPD
jgi:hypothetical protein